jgi:hypothetical protein
LALLGRLPPIALSRGQAMVVLAIVLALLLVGVLGAVVEFLLGQGADLTMRVTGHQRPRKSSARMVIDQLEARISRRP